MKNSVFGLLFLGLTTLAHAQSSNEAPEGIELEDVVVNSSMNYAYLNAVMEDITPASIRAIEHNVANYDIKSSPAYDRRAKEEVYEVVFKSTKGRIIATYDHKGEVLTSFEKFKDVSIPPAIRNSVYKSNPGWTIESNNYQVSYYRNKDAKKMYKLTIASDGDRKNLKISL